MNIFFESLREKLEDKATREKDDFVAFHDWQEPEIRSILSLGNKVNFHCGQDIVKMGSLDDRELYIVISGELEVFHSSEGEEKRVALLRTGNIFGEMSFIDGLPRSANVRALKDSTLLKISPEDLEEFCRRDPTVGIRFMKEIAKILSLRIRRAGDSWLC